MSIAKAVSGIAGIIVALYVISQIHIDAPVEVNQSAVAAIAADTTTSTDNGGLAGLLTAAIVLSGIGALVGKIKNLF